MIPDNNVGAVKATLTELESNMDTVFMVGALGTSGAVVADVDGLDDADVPPELVAVTVNVYAVFDVSPNIVIGDDVPVPVKPPGLLVTVYCVIVPVPDGAVKATRTEFIPNTVGVPIVGAVGFVVA